MYFLTINKRRTFVFNRKYFTEVKSLIVQKSIRMDVVANTHTKRFCSEVPMVVHTRF